MTGSDDIPKINLYIFCNNIGQVKRYRIAYIKYVDSDWPVHSHCPIKG